MQIQRSGYIIKNNFPEAHLAFLLIQYFLSHSRLIEFLNFMAKNINFDKLETAIFDFLDIKSSNLFKVGH